MFPSHDRSGQYFDFLVCDEVAMYRNFWIGWHEVLRPTLTDTRGDVLFISTPKGFNHFYDLYNIQYEDDDYASFHFTSYDNPHVPHDELDKAQEEMTEDRFAQEYMADFRKQEGLVYKEFNRDKHVYDPEKLDDYDRAMLAEPKFVIGGVDFGYTNPAAVLTIKLDSMDNWWITDEWYKTGKTEPEIAEYVAAEGFNYVYADPEAPGAIEQMRKAGVNVRDVVKGKDSIKSGIDKVRELLNADKLKVSKDCINTISEFETYCHPDSKDSEKNETENPLDANNHAMDALRYVITMMLGKTRERVAHVHKPGIERHRKRALVYKPYR